MGRGDVEGGAHVGGGGQRGGSGRSGGIPGAARVGGLVVSWIMILSSPHPNSRPKACCTIAFGSCGCTLSVRPGWSALSPSPPPSDSLSPSLAPPRTRAPRVCEISTRQPCSRATPPAPLPPPCATKAKRTKRTRPRDSRGWCARSRRWWGGRHPTRG